jgi:TonB family protein
LESIRDDSIRVDPAEIENISSESGNPRPSDSSNADADLVDLTPCGQCRSDRGGADGPIDRYISEVRARIWAKWIYPPKAVQFKIEGTVSLEFTLLRDGSLVDITILMSSGWPILDDDIARVVKIAAPFPKFPETMPQKKIVISGKYNYELKSSDD